MNFTFVFTSLIFVLTPGLATMYILNNSIIYGKKEGILSMFGIFSGGMIYNIISAAGLGTLITKFPFVLSGIKIIGAIYLIYTGIKSIMSKGENSREEKSKNCFRNGVITNLSNPKLLIFFITFIPQFVSNSTRSVGGELFILGRIYLLIELIWFLFLVTFTVIFIEKFQIFFQTKMKYISGVAFILMGGLLFL